MRGPRRCWLRYRGRQRRFCRRACSQLGFQADLVALDLRPLPGFPLRDLDIGLCLQALDLGVGRGGLPGDLDLRQRERDDRIG